MPKLPTKPITCIACGGTGKSSRAGSCLPCNGTGKRISLASKVGKDVIVKPITFKPRPELLCLPNIPKPLHRVAPRVVLGSIWWNKVRQAAYESTAFHCIACTVYKHNAEWHKWLEGHEVYDIDYLFGRMTYIETVPLCHLCHCYIHSGRLQAMLDKEEITQEKYDLVIAHGNSLLKRNNLKKPKEYRGPTAVWGDWRLIIKGEEYLPMYSSVEEWQEGHK